MAKQKFKITNWSNYNAALKQRGSLTIWLHESTMTAWTAKTKPVSAKKIGRIANDNNIKTEEFGEYYLDKSRYSNKQVEAFRYNEKALEKFNDILLAELEALNSGLV